MGCSGKKGDLVSQGRWRGGLEWQTVQRDPGRIAGCVARVVRGRGEGHRNQRGDMQKGTKLGWGGESLKKTERRRCRYPDAKKRDGEDRKPKNREMETRGAMQEPHIKGKGGGRDRGRPAQWEEPQTPSRGKVRKRWTFGRGTGGRRKVSGRRVVGGGGTQSRGREALVTGHEAGAAQPGGDQNGREWKGKKRVTGRCWTG